MRSALRHTLLLLRRLGAVLLLYTICRLLFWAVNTDYFSGADIFMAFVGGIRFDLSAIAIINAPIILLSLLPFRFVQRQGYQRFLVYALILLNLPGIALNLVDMEYFKFTGKRSTADLFDLVFLSDDLMTVMPAYLADYWYLFILLGLMLWWAISRVRSMKISFGPSPVKWWGMLGMLLLTVGIWTVLSRGGLQLRPISELSAMEYGRPKDVPLILNTPFSVIRSIGKNTLEVKEYYSEEELEGIYSPVHTARIGASENKDNVMIIIMESFSREYVGRTNENGLAYTPFLDSLSRHSTVVPHGYANGKKSMEALPAIIAGIPALMSDPFITSPYAGVAVDGLPRVLAQRGYSSAFYHGGTTGTMGFDRFAASAGFERYVGLEEYPYDRDYDGNWGIYDGPFLQFMADDIDQMPEPFFSAFFSLSSHHPYSLPESVGDRYAAFGEKLPPTIRYADDALRDFFARSAETSWFDNTLFVITADHTPDGRLPEFREGLGNYRIPMIFFHPSKVLDLPATIAQQTDIPSTVLDLLGTGQTTISFGKSLADSTKAGWCVQYLNGVYQMRYQDQIILMDGEKVINATDLSGNLILEHDRSEQQLKAIIQQFTRRMVDGKVSALED